MKLAAVHAWVFVQRNKFLNLCTIDVPNNKNSTPFTKICRLLELS